MGMHKHKHHKFIKQRSYKFLLMQLRLGINYELFLKCVDLRIFHIWGLNYVAIMLSPVALTNADTNVLHIKQKGLLPFKLGGE